MTAEFATVQTKTKTTSVIINHPSSASNALQDIDEDDILDEVGMDNDGDDLARQQNHTDDGRCSTRLQLFLSTNSKIRVGYTVFVLLLFAISWIPNSIQLIVSGESSGRGSATIYADDIGLVSQTTAALLLFAMIAIVIATTITAVSLIQNYRSSFTNKSCIFYWFAVILLLYANGYWNGDICYTYNNKLKLNLYCRISQGFWWIACTIPIFYVSIFVLYSNGNLFVRKWFSSRVRIGLLLCSAVMFVIAFILFLFVFQYEWEFYVCAYMVLVYTMLTCVAVMVAQCKPYLDAHHFTFHTNVWLSNLYFVSWCLLSLMVIVFGLIGYFPFSSSVNVWISGWGDFILVAAVHSWIIMEVLKSDAYLEYAVIRTHREYRMKTEVEHEKENENENQVSHYNAHDNDQQANPHFNQSNT